VKQNQRNRPTEYQLLAFVEGELSASSEQALIEELAGQSKALRGLECLRADRQMLHELEDPEPPSGLIEDCLAAVERDLLISEDPFAPPIHMPRRRQSALRRYAVAAGFILVATVGGMMIYENILVTPNLPEFGIGSNEPESGSAKKSDLQDASPTAGEFAKNPETGNERYGGENQSDSTDSAKSPLLTNEGEDVNVNNRSLNGTGGTTNLVASSEGETGGSDDDAGEGVVKANDGSATGSTVAGALGAVGRTSNLKPHADDVPFSLGESPADLPSDSVASMDIGLGIRLATIDRTRALERLNELIDDSKGTELIYNAPLIDTVPTTRGFDESLFSDWSVSSSSGDPQANGDRSYSVGIRTPDRNRANNYDKRSRFSPARKQSLVPLEEQHQYRERGFDYTLVGTPTQLIAVLHELKHADDDIGRLRVMKRNGDGSQELTTVSLDELARPAHPVGKDWSRALFWWTDPGRNLALAAQMNESFAPEPIVRIPLQLVGRH